MNFEEALHYMEGRIRFGWKLDLERFTELCRRLGNPQNRFPVIHIAGTKGKGSTTALAAGILKAAGYQVGSYFSPYVYDVRERIQINSEMIPKEAFARLVTEVRQPIEELEKTSFGTTTEFELKTAVGFLYFAEQNVDFACIEVGLGGRLDATNIVHPAVTVITNIGLDHTEILGETHALIAAEKAGIIKPGVPCFTATDNAEALAVITRIAYERNAPLFRVALSPAEEADVLAVLTGDPHTGTVTIRTPQHTYLDLPMRMGGVYQRVNAACAVAAVEAALSAQNRTLPEAAVREGLATTAIPGRLSVLKLPHGPLLVSDGAHNALAAEALSGPVATLQKQYGIENTTLVIGMVGGHDPAGVLAALTPGTKQVIVCAPAWKRAQPAEAVAAVARKYTPNVVVIPNVREAVKAAVTSSGEHDLVLISGSFYTVGEAPPAFLETL